MTETPPEATTKHNDSTDAPGLPDSGTVQTRDQLLSAVNSRTRRAAVLRQAGGGPIVGLAVTLARNPDAPRRIVVGDADRAQSEARQIVSQTTPLPVWVKAANQWTFTGCWQPVRLVDDATVLLLDAVGTDLEADALRKPPGLIDAAPPPTE